LVAFIREIPFAAFIIPQSGPNVNSKLKLILKYLQINFKFAANRALRRNCDFLDSAVCETREKGVYWKRVPIL